MRTIGDKTIHGLTIGVGVLALAIVVRAVIAWAVIGDLERRDIAGDDLRNELFHYSAMYEAVEEQELGLRGYRLNRDPQALAMYQDARARFVSGLPKLRALESDDPPAMKARIDDLVLQVGAWNRNVAEPQIAALQAGEAVAPDATLGQGYIDAVRDDVATMRRAKKGLLDGRGGPWSSTIRYSRFVLLVGSGLGLLYALALGRRSIRRAIAVRAAERETARQVAEALERATTAERAKATFLTNMSHEMLTPLNGVAGMAQALAHTGLDAPQREMVRVIASCSADLEGLIGNLLTLAGADRSQPAEAQKTEWAFDVAEEVRAIAADHRRAAEAKGLRLRLEPAVSAEVRVRGDAARLERVLNSLLSNAVKFTDRGEVRLAVARVAGDRFRFEVADTGVGFDDSRKAALFQTFTQSDDGLTRRFGGAGVGLAVASRLTAELGGRLDCRSTPGAGASFVLELDLAAADADPEPEPGPLAARRVPPAAAPPAPVQAIIAGSGLPAVS